MEACDVSDRITPLRPSVPSFKAEYIPLSLKTPFDYIYRTIIMQTVLEDADYS